MTRTFTRSDIVHASKDAPDYRRIPFLQSLGIELDDDFDMDRAGTFTVTMIPHRSVIGSWRSWGSRTLLRRLKEAGWTQTHKIIIERGDDRVEGIVNER